MASTTDAGQRAMRECVICCETEVALLINPCRKCTTSWCIGCLEDAFRNAVAEKSHFQPPRCCVLLQLHTVKDRLGDKTAHAYRGAFKEWLYRDKAYCPVPTCSAFIPGGDMPGRDSTAAFKCPACATKICPRCRQIAHEGVCDKSRETEEEALLKKFKLRKCPRCGQAVKKMFGCEHMVCVCGANLCWRCGRSIEQCGEDCEDFAADEDEDEAEEGDYGVRDRDDGDENTGRANANPTRDDPAGAPIGPGHMPESHEGRDSPNVDLDAGGEARWGQAEEDFGDEPGDEPSSQVFSCPHKFEIYEPTLDGLYHGDLDLMECNRCSANVVPAQIDPSGAKHAEEKEKKEKKEEKNFRFKHAGSLQAMECDRCRLVVCLGCKARYESEQAGGQQS